MRNLFLMVFALSGFFGQILGSEKSKRLYHLQENYNEKISSPFDLLCIKETRFYAKVTVAYNLLCYSDKNYINFLNQNYGIKCSDNEPFIRIQYLGMHKDQQNLKEKFIDLITLVPLRYFLV